MSATRGVRRPAVIPVAHPPTPARLARLSAGLALFGLSLALMMEADLGLGPWDVLHQGIAERLGVDVGRVIVAVGAAVLVAWAPLGERPGLGTVANVVVVGIVVDASLAVLPGAAGLAPRGWLLAGGIALNGAATALYIGAGLGAGPRDGLMTGISRRGHSLGAVRTAIEAAVLAGGMALGGAAGVGTVAYALAIGPLVHHLLPLVAVADPAPGRATVAP